MPKASQPITLVTVPYTKAPTLQTQNMLCTVFEIFQHTCKTLHTVIYIRHIVQKGNLMQSLGKHIYLKYKTQLKLEKHTDSHT